MKYERNKEYNIELTEKDEMLEDINEIVDYIAFNNRNFICTTCLEVLDRLKDFVYTYYGLNTYMETSNIIQANMEDEEDE